MIFLSGPRQVGKTTLARYFLKDKNFYFTWDDLRFRREWNKSPISFVESKIQNPQTILVLDELHKYPKWKNSLKGVYDLCGSEVKIILTGSAHLNTFRKGADSLLGRFIHFHLHPLSLGELRTKSPIPYLKFIENINSLRFAVGDKIDSKTTIQLLQWGGFPEPFLSKSEEIHQIWSKNRLELLVRQDLRDISNFLDYHQVEVLASILPEKVGSLFSVTNLREDLDVAHTTLTRWLIALQSIYYHYSIQPYHFKIIRSLKKEGKIYLYDWSAVPNLGARFENMVASHLLKLVDYYNDTGQSSLNLKFLRNKEKQEVDFILLQNQKPILTLEVKVSDEKLDMTFQKFHKSFQVPHIQIIQTPGVYRLYKKEKACVLSFDAFFKNLP
jgi:hypothetical protein